MSKVTDTLMPWWAAIKAYWPLIKFALLLGIIVAVGLWQRSAGYEVRINEENRDKVAAQVASDKFAELWNNKEAELAKTRSEERFDYNHISKEISNDFQQALRRQPFDVKCTWPPELLDLRSKAIERANQAASGLPRASD